MKQVIWVIGTSASGKSTFIKTIKNYPKTLRALGWDGKNIAICNASIVNIGHKEWDPIVKKRKNILNEVDALLESNDIVLIKWQYIDSRAKRPERLMSLIPSTRHSIIELQAPLEELAIRLKDKSWWSDYGNEELSIRSELKSVKKWLQKLAVYMPITTINSSASGKYEIQS